MNQKLRLATQAAFLVLFVFLFLTGRMQLWMGVLLGTVVLAALLGRFYCGWLCPINTLMAPVEKLRRRLGWKERSVPQWAKSPLLRYGILFAFVAVMALTLIKGVKLPVVLILIPVALGCTFFFVPDLWHRYLCPYGILFSLTAAAAPFKLGVDADQCTSCGLCIRVCPAEAVNLEGSRETAVIEGRHCLECFLCQEACPRNAISYGRG